MVINEVDKIPVLTEIFLGRNGVVEVWRDLGAETIANKLLNYYFKRTTTEKEHGDFT